MKRRSCAMTAGHASLLLAAWLLLPPYPGRAEAASPSDAAVAATLKRDTARCRARSDLDACYDAVRRNPGDASISVALGDALRRAKRPADALRSYRRAATQAPNTPGLAAKIAGLEGNPPGKRVTHSAPAERAAPDRAPSERASARRFTNAATDGQSH